MFMLVRNPQTRDRSLVMLAPAEVLGVAPCRYAVDAGALGTDATGAGATAIGAGGVGGNATMRD